MKAAYLLHFTKYIEWQADASAKSLQPLHICLQSGTPFMNFLQNLVGSRTTSYNKRAVKVVSMSDAGVCHLSYLYRTSPQLSNAVQSSVIVVDSKRDVREPGAVTFYIDDRKLRFEIDVAMMRRQQVTVSSELLKLARIR